MILFDSHLLPRQIKKFDKELLKRKNENFSLDFCLELFDCFIKNEKSYDGYGKCCVYSRIENNIILKYHDEIGLGEYDITSPICSLEFFDLINENYGQELANKITSELCYMDDLESFKRQNWGLSAEAIVEAINKIFYKTSDITKVKRLVALFWLEKYNSHEIKLM